MTPTNSLLVTFAIFSYNQEAYLRGAIQGAFAQTYDNLEILISDDCSQDSSQSIIRNLVSAYQGPHKLRVNFNPKNLGIGQHVNRVFELAAGGLLVLAAGDDISVPERTQRTVDAWADAGRAPSAIYCGAKTIDSQGDLTGRIDTAIAVGGRDAATMISYDRKSPLLLLGACAAYTPDVYFRFGPLRADLTIEDIPLAVRASLLGGVAYLNEELVLYRANVSVWLPRKLRLEGFKRHRDRMAHRTRANYLVFKQIFRDVRSISPRRVKRLAAQHYIAAKFSLRTLQTQRFSLTAYSRVLRLTPFWRSSAFPALLFAFPAFHRALFAINRLFSRKRN